MAALGHGDLDAAHASVNIVPVKPNSRDELGEMAESFNVLQEEVRKAAIGLDEARHKMRVARVELLAQHKEIAYLAHHDALTNLANRPALNMRLASALEQATADGTGFAILSVDLDQFKEANDVFGHVVGDELLCAIARRLEQAVGDAFIARVGGDEFTIVSADAEQPQAASALADRVLKSLEADFEIRGQKVPISLSIGVAVYPIDGRDTETVLANADAALYRAKGDGRHTVRFFDPEMDKRLRALRAPARSSLGHCPWRACRTLPATGQDRRRSLRLRGAAPLEPFKARTGAANDLHSPRRAERHDRRDRGMDAASGLPRGCLLDPPRCRSA